jgi:uncharacterized membrane protein YphA (DoxX/SURF4 family)
MGKIISTVSRIIVGSLFIFSGLVKLNDPYGTAYKLEEYFHVFSADFGSFFEFFIPYSLFLSIAIVGLEVILGVAVLLNYRMKQTTWILLLLIVFFTFLTFYSFYFDKVKECGCFGTLIVLTPKQSFYKDLVLLFFILIIFFLGRNQASVFNSVKGDMIMLMVSALTFYAGYHAASHLPYFDTLNFKTGNHIPTLMKAEETPRYKFILSKEGKEFEFLQENYPSDTSYKFVRYELLNKDTTKLVPKIIGFSVDSDEGDKTDEILTGKRLIITMPDVKKAFNNCSDGCVNDLKALVTQAEKLGLSPVILTDPGSAEILELFRHELQLAVPYYFMDDVILKMMVRSNPGIVLLKDGTVKGKWHYNDIPDSDKLQMLLK